MKTAGWRLPILFALLLVGFCSRATAETDPWAACRFLMGEWTAEGGGRPADTAGQFGFAFDLEGKVLVRRNLAEIPSTPERAGVSHRDLMVVYPEGERQALKAIYFDNEEHVIKYAVHGSTDGKQLTFLSEQAPGRPRFRLVYEKQAEDRVKASFAMAAPDSPEDFKPYLEGTARRTPRSEIGPGIPRGYVAHRAAGTVNLDGKLDETDWRNASWTDPFVDIEGDVKPRPKFRTRAKMLWDDNYFYVGALLEEPHIWGTLTKHDSVIFQDNDFEIFIDPDGDNHEYYEIEINALNTEWDLFLKKPYRDGGPAINEWEIPGLKTGVHIAGTLNDPRDTDQYWSVEFAIPWKVLAEYAHRPSPPKDGDQWRVNFSRVEWRHEVVDGKDRRVPNTREDNWVWSPQGYIDMHRPEYWGYVQFSTGTPGRVAFRPDPAGPIRDRLVEIYRAQGILKNKGVRPADRIEQLNLSLLPAAFPDHEVTIHSTSEGYEAAITFQPTGADPQTWTIKQDSRIVRKP